MKKLHLLTLLIAVLAVFGAAAAQAAKVNVCHLPPGNPDNWHTISVSENALQAHLNHGDLEGSCLANCETLCDDGDACTQDVQADSAQCVCLPVPLPVNCDDSNPCTADSCDSLSGACVYDSDVPTCDSCDDGDPGTTTDFCLQGECFGIGPTAPCPCDPDPYSIAINLGLDPILCGITQVCGITFAASTVYVQSSVSPKAISAFVEEDTGVCFANFFEGAKLTSVEEALGCIDTVVQIANDAGVACTDDLP